jgi:hypothetical protein
VSKRAHLSLVKWKPEAAEPLTAAALQQQLQTHATAVSTLARDWATRDDPVSFKDVEQAVRLAVFAFARIAIMLFLALREEQLMRVYGNETPTRRSSSSMTGRVTTPSGWLRSSVIG